MAIDARRRREWISYNPILKKNDLAIDLNDNSLKLGDGQTRWSDLSVLLIKAQEPVNQADLDSAISVAVSNLVNSAPGTMDTLGELAALLSSDEDAAAALATTVSGKLAKASNLSDLEDVAAAKTNLSLVKGDVGLGNVDNTADTAKPISIAQQAALDLKAPLASPALTGNPTAPTPSAGDNDTSIATSAFVAGEISTHVGATGAHAADKVSVTTSGLVAITHTDVQAALADLDAALMLKAPLARSIEGIPWFLAGHSYGLVPPYGGSASGGANWITRLANELHPTSLENASVGGDWVQNTAGRLLGTQEPIGPNFKGALLLDIGVNDMGGSASAKCLAGITNGIKSLIAGAQAASKIVETNAAFTYTGTWGVLSNAAYGSGGAKYSTTSGDNVSIALPALASGLFYTLLMVAIDDSRQIGQGGVGGCTAVEVKLDGSVQSTISLSDTMLQTSTGGVNQADYGIGFYALRVPGNGSARTLLLTSQAGGLFGVDDLLIPQANPPQVIVFSQPPWSAASFASFGGDTSLAAINAAIQSGMSSYDSATVTFVDTTPGWNPSTMCSSVDGVHPNDLGHATRTRVIAAALQALPFRNGMNVL